MPDQPIQEVREHLTNSSTNFCFEGPIHPTTFHGHRWIIEQLSMLKITRPCTMWQRFRIDLPFLEKLEWRPFVRCLHVRNLGKQNWPN
eukprot:scaffold1063_cov318-Pavlova_lutheri.AAC.10